MSNLRYAGVFFFDTPSLLAKQGKVRATVGSGNIYRDKKVIDLKSY
jgi:hypothetical protein